MAYNFAYLHELTRTTKIEGIAKACFLEVLSSIACASHRKASSVMIYSLIERKEAIT